MRHSHRLAWLLLAVVPIACGKKRPSTVPVSGQVTIDNYPLANAVITFTPVEGKPSAESSARTDEQGRFSLKLKVNNRDGAVPGSHRVRISLFDRGNSTTAGKGQRLPAEYNRNSALTFSVPAAGTREANFNLSMAGRPGWTNGSR